jgi:hypothetical protein
MANTKQNNAQGEMQLIAEWLMTLPPTYQSKTRVNVGAQELFYAGMALTPAQSKAFGVWNDWSDARVFTGTQVWIVEGKLVATGGAYGQVLDYVNQYPSSLDYQQFAPAPIVPMVVTMASRPRTAALFAGMGVQTIVFQPSFPLAQALAKLFPAAQVLGGTGAP